MNIFSRITLRVMAQNRTRTIVTIIGVILSTAMITALATFGVSFRQFLVDYSISRDGNWHLMVQGIEAEDGKALTDSREVEQAAVVTELGYALFEPVQDKTPQMPYLYVQSLSQEAMEMLPVELVDGRMPENENEAVVSATLLFNEDQGQATKVGDTLTLELGDRFCDGERLSGRAAYMDGQEGDTETFVPRETRSFMVVGIYDSWPGESYGAGYGMLSGPLLRENSAVIESGQAADEEHGQKVRQDIFLRMKHPRDVYQFAREKLSGLDGIAYTFNQSLLRWLGVSDNERFYTVVIGLMTVLLAVIVTGSVTLIYNAFSISLRERTAQFGLLSSLGATKRQLRSAMRCEALVVSAVGIPLGILAGVGGIGITLHFIGKAISNWIHGSRMGIALVVTPWSILAAVGIAFLTIMISVWLPSRRIRRISPIEAIRSSEDIKIRPGEVKTSSLTMRLFGLEGMMAEKNYKRDRKKYRATVVSLAMSIVLFMAAALFNIYLVGTGSFVLEAPETDIQYTLYEHREDDDDTEEQRRQAKELVAQNTAIKHIFTYGKAYLIIALPDEWMEPDFLNQYGYSEHSVDGRTPVECGIYILPDDVFSSFAKSCGVDGASYIEAEELRLLYLNEERSYNSQTQRYERVQKLQGAGDEKLWAGKFDYQSDGSDRLIKTGEVSLGDAVSQLPEEIGEGGDILSAFIPETMYERFKDTFTSKTTVLNISCESPSQTFEELEEELRQNGLEDVGWLRNMYEEYESDRNALMAVKVLTYGFIVLISLIAVANVFNTISTNLMLRRKEFAMLRSMGMSPRGLRRMMNYECLIYGFRAICYGIVLSLLLGLLIKRIIGEGADMGFLVPWRYLAIAVAGVFAVVFVTMLYTMHKIKQNNIVEELKMS